MSVSFRSFLVFIILFRCHIVVICAHYLKIYTVIRHTNTQIHGHSTKTYKDTTHIHILDTHPYPVRYKITVRTFFHLFASHLFPIGNSIQLIFKYDSGKVIQFLRIFVFLDIFMHEAKSLFVRAYGGKVNFLCFISHLERFKLEQFFLSTKTMEIV